MRIITLDTKCSGALLFLFVAAQPVLDAIAFWSSDSFATAAGIIRLVIMLVYPLYLFIVLRDKKRIIVPMALIGGFCLLHILNCFRLGYINPLADIRYMAKVAQMPIIAVCLMISLKDLKDAAPLIKGLGVSTAIYLFLLLLALVTGTWNSTYGDGIGFSGWVINDNRCANSLILVTLCIFIMYFAVSTRKKLPALLGYSLIFLLLIMNGTKACYYSLFIILLCFALYECGNAIFKKIKISWFRVIVPIALIILSVLIYPYTPRAKEDAVEANNNKAEVLLELQDALAIEGYTTDSVTMEIVMTNKTIFKAYDIFYKKLMCGGVPELFETFDSEEIIRYYNLSTDVEMLMDVRVIKRTFSTLIFRDCDFLTKLVGFDIGKITFENSVVDPENDWPALMWFYGYIGLTIYVCFILLVLIPVAKKLLEDFNDAYNVLNVSLLVCLILQLGLAQFSGAILRRPNVSIYMSVILALVYFRTRVQEKNICEGYMYEA